MVKMFGISVDESSCIDSFEITIKPKPKKNIDQAVKKIISKTDEDGLDKFTLKAKENIDENLTDFYLVGKGQVSDILTSNSEEEVAQQIHKKTKDNILLQNKIREFKGNGAFKEEEPQAFIAHHDVSTWPGGVGSI